MCSTRNVSMAFMVSVSPKYRWLCWPTQMVFWHCAQIRRSERLMLVFAGASDHEQRGRQVDAVDFLHGCHIFASLLNAAHGVVAAFQHLGFVEDGAVVLIATRESVAASEIIH